MFNILHFITHAYRQRVSDTEYRTQVLVMDFYHEECKDEKNSSSSKNNYSNNTKNGTNSQRQAKRKHLKNYVNTKKTFTL